MIRRKCLAPRAAVALIAIIGGSQSSIDVVRLAAAAEEDSQPKLERIAGVDWHTDYYDAYRAAARASKMLLINVTPNTGGYSQQQDVESYIARNPQMQEILGKIVCARVPADATIDVEGRTQSLLSYPSFAHLQGGPGFVLIDLAHENTPYYGHTVNVLPYASGKYYHWRSDYLWTALNVPAGTLTQRTMIWAVRIHPERPQSTSGEFDRGLAAGSTQHASYQANVGVQGHQHFESRSGQLASSSGSSGVSEVCAESWPNQNLIDSCIDCVASWRHSPGHWRGVSRPHRRFGYDIRRGRNGIWYGTGIFGD